MQPVPRSFQAHRPVLDEAWPAQPPGSPRYDPKQNFRLPLELEILTNRRCARHGFNEDLLLANTRASGENALASRKITDLNAASVRINGLYLRLQDPLPSSAPNLAQLPTPVNNGLRQTEPTVIQDFVRAGLAAVPSAVTRTEASTSYELGSTRFEFHRLIPLIAQAENSNVLLFLDHLELVRPKTNEPFSLRPTALQARFKARIFTAGTR